MRPQSDKGRNRTRPIFIHVLNHKESYWKIITNLWIPLILFLIRSREGQLVATLIATIIPPTTHPSQCKVMNIYVTGLDLTTRPEDGPALAKQLSTWANILSLVLSTVYQLCLHQLLSYPSS